MPKVITHAVIWLAEQDRYVWHSFPAASSSLVEPWFTWLAGRSSFAFQGQRGHLTLRKEVRAGGEGYWYAYRCQKRRTVKRYVGRTAELTIERLEAVAAEITAAFARPPLQKQAPEPEGPAPAAALLLPKLRAPHLHSSLVARERLLHRLDACLERKMTMLSAPAGFGKTTLVRQWIAARSEQAAFPPVAWVSLDEGDNDPLRFWRAVVTSARSWYDVPDRYTRDLLLTSSQAHPPYMKSFSLENVLTDFLNEVVLRDISGILILEDYHIITENRIHETLAFFLSHLPETLHIVLITRREPPLQLARLRANGDLDELQAADLRFSSEESATFLQAYALDKEVLEQLDAYLEGWAAGLRLLLISLQGKTPQQVERTLATFSGSHRPILDYFVTEVLDAQNEEIQGFLLRTSSLARLNPSLCAAVTGVQESGSLLERIERANLFLEALDDPSSSSMRDSSERWYRYHALFAQSMQHEARRRLSEDELRTLSHKASRWFEEHGLLMEAIEAAFKAQESTHAALLIEQFIQAEQFREAHEHYTLRRWLEQLPEPLLKQRPLLCLTYAAALIFTQDQSEVNLDRAILFEEMLRIAEEIWRAEENRPRLGEVLACRSFYLFHEGKRDLALSYAREALDLLPADEVVWRGLTMSLLGMRALFVGELREARQIFQQVEQLWKRISDARALDGSAFLLGVICHEMAEPYEAARYFQRFTTSNIGEISLVARIGSLLVYYEWNDLEAINREMQEIEAQKGYSTDLPVGAFDLLTDLVYARTEYMQGELEPAMQRLTGLVPRLRGSPEEFFFVYYDTLFWLVRLSLKLDDLSAAQYWLNELIEPRGRALGPVNSQSLEVSAQVQALELGEVDRQGEAQTHLGDSSVLHELRILLTARIFLARGEAEAALSLLIGVLSSAYEAGRLLRAVQMKVLIAQAYAACNQIAEARQYLIEALEEGQRRGLLRVFLDEDDALFSLMRDLLPHLHGQALQGYVQRLLQSFIPTKTVTSSIAISLFEPLSSQEQRVLRLLVAGLSSPEIARNLVVSVNTVRTQIQSIYRKLNVHNRHEAMTVARQLHIV